MRAGRKAGDLTSRPFCVSLAARLYSIVQAPTQEDWDSVTASVEAKAGTVFFTPAVAKET